MQNELCFDIRGAIVPYVRMTQRGKFINQRAIAYLNNQAGLRTQFAQQMTGEPFDKTPLAVVIELWERHLHTHDLDNTEKALLDAMRGVVFVDDRYVDSLVAMRESTAGEEHAIVMVQELKESRKIERRGIMRILKKRARPLRYLLPLLHKVADAVAEESFEWPDEDTRDAFADALGVLFQILARAEEGQE